MVGFAGVSHAPWLGAQDSSRPLVRFAGLITPFGWVYRYDGNDSEGSYLVIQAARDTGATHVCNLSIDLLLPRKSAYSSCDTTD